jgi:alpha-tubulin suppressor-like RCC1 family protein
MADLAAQTVAALLDLPLEVLTHVCLQLDLRALVRVAHTCKRLRLGEGGLQTVELPTKSPVIPALCDLAFPGGGQGPSTRPIGCSESWVAYLARCARQRRCREAPPIAAGLQHALFVDATRQLLARGSGAAVGRGGEAAVLVPTAVTVAAGVRVRSIAAADSHSLAVGWDSRVFAWGLNGCGLLGLGDKLDRLSPTLLGGLEGVRGVAAASYHNLAVTQSGDVFRWGRDLLLETQPSLRPIIVEGFGRVRVRQVYVNPVRDFAITEDGELFSWGSGKRGTLGHGDMQDQPSPKRVEALRGVRVSGVAMGTNHALALAEDGLVYAWGANIDGATLGNAHVERELLPTPVEALRGVHVCSVAAAGDRSYAVADTGELWAWGYEIPGSAPFGHGEQMHCPLPKPIESLRGVKVDAVAASLFYTLALADDGSVHAWGCELAAGDGALGLGPSVSEARMPMHTPPRSRLRRHPCGTPASRGPLHRTVARQDDPREGIPRRQPLHGV